MPRLDRLIVALLVACGLLLATGCNRLTFIKPNLKKVKVEQVRRPVVAYDSPAVKARVSAQEQVNAAGAAFAQGDIATAEKHARAALKMDAQSIDARTLLGAIAQRNGRRAEAGEHFKQAALLSQGRPAEAANYGAWLCDAGQAAEGLKYFDYAAQSQSSEARAGTLANAGACATGAGLDARGETYLRDALSLDASNPQALESMAGLALRRGQGMDARAFIQRRLSIPPASASALSTAAQIETRLGDARAAQMYKQRLQNEFPPSNPTPKGK